MPIRVREIINSAKRTLQEQGAEGVRWTNQELVEYLNDAYRFLVEVEPEAFADNSEFECAAGTRQEIPANASRLIAVKRNIDGRMMPVTATDSETLGRVRPYWHSENPTNEQELFVYDERDPKRFYVYPPAVEGSLIEIVCAMEPEKHLVTHYEDNETQLRTTDRHYPALLNYILFRAFDKDGDGYGNFQRGQSYLAAAYNSLGAKLQNAARVSPNNPVN